MSSHATDLVYAKSSSSSSSTSYDNVHNLVAFYRVTPSVSRRPLSVFLSVQTAKPFSLAGGLIIPVFCPSALTQFQGNPSDWWQVHCKRGLRKIRNFRPISRYILKTLQDSAVVAMVPDRSMSVPMTLSDLERRTQEAQFLFSGGSSHTLVPTEQQRSNSAW